MTFKTIKTAGLGILLASFMIFSTGCPGQEPQPKPQTNNVKIGVSLASMDFDGNQTIKKYMDQRKQRENVQITWMDAQMDPSKQEQDIDKLIEQKVKAIVLQVVSPQEGVRLVEKITQAKIKVIGLETLPANAPLDGYIASDHTRAGELQGMLALNKMLVQSQQTGQQPNFNVLILKGDPVDPVSQKIASGAQGVLQQSQNVGNVKVVEHSEGKPEFAQMTVQKSLQTEKVDAILATDGQLCMAALKELKKQGLEGQIVTVGVGADKQSSQALAAGEHDAEIDIMPEQLANFAFDAAVDLINKGNWNSDTRIQNGNFDIPAKIIPVRLVQQEQIYLLEERWGKLEPQQGGQQQGQQEQQGQQGQENSPGQGDQEGQEGSEQQSDQGQGGGQKTKVRIVTQDGKVMEVEVDGEIKAIESQGAEGGQEGQAGEQEGGGQGGGGQ
ncbi:substrate-binding domain-containing protein [Desulforamulus aquiferis]|uniref:Substrate-binding domain-containing protein n=1 Tax=Desulforamulus aquiferis TaxID=1397668 RepID=A0AAW7ZDF5_9FIRM|nr:substrate-binding domain-containing protein [Desulforamulus aquiferis]MDO7787789.1 substrate-binding domain-containing protein [Desulforamulus aquiferis]RYD05374.1 hypothetical protein N752_09765 [Desulforamulus aquiferis]